MRMRAVSFKSMVKSNKMKLSFNNLDRIYVGFICLPQRRMPTNARIFISLLKHEVTVNLKDLKDFSTLTLKIGRPIKYSNSSGMTHQLITRATVSGISIQSFLLWFHGRADQVPPPTTIFVCLFVFLSVCLFLCFDDGYVNKSLDNSLPADITSQVYNNAHIYTHYTHTHIHTHTHTHTLNYGFPCNILQLQFDDIQLSQVFPTIF